MQTVALTVSHPGLINNFLYVIILSAAQYLVVQHHAIPPLCSQSTAPSVVVGAIVQTHSHIVNYVS